MAGASGSINAEAKGVTEPLLPPEGRYASLVEAMVGKGGVTYGSPGGGSRRAFGGDALKVGDRIFAMLVRGRLVVKLPRRRVVQLIGSGEGSPFEPRPGRAMTEWFVVSETSDLDWAALAAEARDYVGGPHPT